MLKTNKDKKLNPKFQQIRNHNRQGNNDSGKINFTKNTGIAAKRIGRTIQTGCKVIPYGDSRQIKQKRRHCSGINTSNTIKYNRKSYRSKQRLNQVPKWSQNRLFIYRHHIAFYKKEQ